MDNITFITGNTNKASEVARMLGTELQQQSINLPEIQSLDITEVVTHKAKAAYEKVQRTVLVEDSALTFHALGKLPGTYIKWFLDEIGTTGLCKLLDGFSDRSATAVACFGLYDGVDLHTFIGNCTGVVTDTPRAGEGFGFDYIFIPTGYNKAWSELGHGEKDKMSHRSQAILKLKEFLENGVK